MVMYKYPREMTNHMFVQKTISCIPHGMSTAMQHFEGPAII